MWEYISLLPADLVGEHVLNFLNMGEIVKLERALAGYQLEVTFRSFLLYCSCKDIPVWSNSMQLIWYQKRNLHINVLKLNFDQFSQHINIKFVKEIHLYIRIILTSELLDSIQNTMFWTKVSSITIRFKQDNKIMKKLFQYLKNIHNIKIVKSNSDEWLTDSLNCLYNNQDKDYKNNITSINLYNANDNTISTIAILCKKLQYLYIGSSIKMTYNSLITLSECSLSLENLEVPWIPIPNTVISDRCAHALSRIRHFSTPVFNNIQWPANEDGDDGEELMFPCVKDEERNEGVFEGVLEEEDVEEGVFEEEEEQIELDDEVGFEAMLPILPYLTGVHTLRLEEHEDHLLLPQYSYSIHSILHIYI